MGGSSMLALGDVAVLLVGGGAVGRERIQPFLEERGARVRAADDADAARRILERWQPDVIVTDVAMPKEDGCAMMAKLRARRPGHAARDVPAIALAGDDGEATRALSRGSDFQKHLMKPVSLQDLVYAIASLTARARAPSEGPDGAALGDEALLARVVELAGHHDMRGLLGVLNARTRYRFTSIFRFDGDRLVSVWTFDRMSPEADPSPAELPIGASYCVFVRDACAPFVMDDSQRDPRVLHHRKRDSVRAYCGVPLLRHDGSMVGSLCHFDLEARPIDPDTVDLMVQVARALTPQFEADEDAARSPWPRSML
jgi:CheY-like chemotaxis protein